MASKERPGPAFIALRAATLGVDDVSRQALRAWAMDALDHRGQAVPDEAGPTEGATVAIVAAVFTLTDGDRAGYRLWLLKWTDYTGRIITPSEHERRQEELMASRAQQPEPKTRGRR